MSTPMWVSITECPIGEIIHAPHQWRQGLFFLKYGCTGFSQKDQDMFALLKAGSEGVLTRERARDYLNKYGSK